jgi:hypothetical protein
MPPLYEIFFRSLLSLYVLIPKIPGTYKAVVYGIIYHSLFARFVLGHRSRIVPIFVRSPYVENFVLCPWSQPISHKFTALVITHRVVGPILTESWATCRVQLTMVGPIG